MADKQHIQRLTIALKSGRIFVIDFAAQENGILNPQIQQFINLVGDPDNQDKAFVFQGQRVVGVRIGEAAAFEVNFLVLTPKEEGKEQAPAKEQAK